MESTHGKPGRTEDRCRDWKGGVHSVEMTFSLKLNIEKKKSMCVRLIYFLCRTKLWLQALF